jgi:hypothetical protein
MNRLSSLRSLTLLALIASSTAFTFNKILPRLQPLHAASGEDTRSHRSKSFSPIETVTSSPKTNDNRYSNNVASHVSTLYGGGEVVQDFKAGSASKHTAPSPSDANGGSYGAVALTASRGQAIQDFREGSASKHTSSGSYAPIRAAVSTTFAYASSLSPNDPDYPGDKHFQLEELEDAETCTTDIYLNADNTITVGTTNGPLFLSGKGTWSTSSSDGKTLFEMIMTRRYQTGKEGKQKTDIGEFEYDVKRTFRGELTLVGGTALAVNGEILDVDTDGIFDDRRVSFTCYILTNHYLGILSKGSH